MWSFQLLKATFLFSINTVDIIFLPSHRCDHFSYSRPHFYFFINTIDIILSSLTSLLSFMSCIVIIINFIVITLLHLFYQSTIPFSNCSIFHPLQYSFQQYPCHLIAKSAVALTSSHSMSQPLYITADWYDIANFH